MKKHKLFSIIMSLTMTTNMVSALEIPDISSDIELSIIDGASSSKETHSEDSTGSEIDDRNTINFDNYLADTNNTPDINEQNNITDDNNDMIDDIITEESGNTSDNIENDGDVSEDSNDTIDDNKNDSLGENNNSDTSDDCDNDSVPNEDVENNDSTIEDTIIDGSTDDDITIDTSHIVEIPDNILESIFRDALNKPDGEITTSDLENINGKLAIDYSVNNLEGLQHCKNVTELDIYCYSSVDNFDVIMNLPKLEYLDISNLYIEDSHIDVISSLTSLQYLKFSPQTRELSKLATLNNLVRLDFIAPIKNADISFLSKLPSLEVLEFKSSNITSEQMPESNSLEELYIEGSVSGDFSFIQTMPKLSTLSISVPKLSSVAGLSNSSSLNHLYLEYVGIKDLNELYNLPNLHTLRVTSANNLVSLSGIESMTSLQNIDIDGYIKNSTGMNKISDLEPLRNLPNLLSIRINGGRIRNIEPLIELSKKPGIYINLSENQITEIPQGYKASSTNFEDNFIDGMYGQNDVLFKSNNNSFTFKYGDSVDSGYWRKSVELKRRPDNIGARMLESYEFELQLDDMSFMDDTLTFCKGGTVTGKILVKDSSNNLITTIEQSAILNIIDTRPLNCDLTIKHIDEDSNEELANKDTYTLDENSSTRFHAKNIYGYNPINGMYQTLEIPRGDSILEETFTYKKLPGNKIANIFDVTQALGSNGDLELTDNSIKLSVTRNLLGKYKDEIDYVSLSTNILNQADIENISPILDEHNIGLLGAFTIDSNLSNLSNHEYLSFSYNTLESIETGFLYKLDIDNSTMEFISVNSITDGAFNFSLNSESLSDYTYILSSNMHWLDAEDDNTNNEDEDVELPKDEEIPDNEYPDGYYPGGDHPGWGDDTDDELPDWGDFPEWGTPPPDLGDYPDGYYPDIDYPGDYYPDINYPDNEIPEDDDTNEDTNDSDNNSDNNTGNGGDSNDNTSEDSNNNLDDNKNENNSDDVNSNNNSENGNNSNDNISSNKEEVTGKLSNTGGISSSIFTLILMLGFSLFVKKDKSKDY